jgi:hypothetical protein
LAHGKYAGCRDVGIAEQLGGDEHVVGRRLRVGEYRCELLEVLGAQVVRDVAHGLARQALDRLGLHAQERGAVDLERRHALAGQVAVFRRVGADGEEVGIGELGHGVTVVVATLHS